MKRYKSLFETKTIDIVYHNTTYGSAINIIKHNYFRTTSGINQNKKGLSTSYDPNYWWGSKEVKFVLNFKKLKKDYDYEFIDEGLKYSSGKSLKESEIRIYGKPIISDIDQYIIKVLIKNSYNNLTSTLYSLLENKHIPYEKI